MARDQVDLTPIERRDDLVDWIAQGVKPKSQFRIGTEHEKFAFTLEGHRPVPYEGRRGIRALLEGMQHLLGWQPIMEGPNVIGLFDVTGGGAISLEPGGQFELSGAQVETVHQTSSELMAHLAQVREVAQPLHIGFLGIGMTPSWTRAEMPKMPKGRYKIMTAYMPKVGKLGLDMMYRTCTVQTNLDFSSEADMVKKLRVSIALQPVATALFANSPFTEGKPNGFLSFRSEIWRDTDNARAGMLPWAFEHGMGFERWVDYALDVPMYFVKHGDEYVDVVRPIVPRPDGGQAARHARRARDDFRLGEPHLHDFPEVRLKRYLEMRGADSARCQICWRCRRSGSASSMTTSVLDAAWDLVKNWTADERQAASRRRAKGGPRRESRRPHRIRNRHRCSPACARRAGAPQASRHRRRRREASISTSWTIASPAARRRRRNCWKNSTDPGLARSIRSTRKRRTRPRVRLRINTLWPCSLVGARKTRAGTVHSQSRNALAQLNC